MGSLISNDSTLHLDDRALTHLQYVIVQKYRRGESFLLTWTDGGADDGRERSWWMSPSAPLSFEFDGTDEAPLELGWVDVLTRSADSTSGLRIVDATGRAVAVRMTSAG